MNLCIMENGKIKTALQLAEFQRVDISTIHHRWRNLLQFEGRPFNRNAELTSQEITALSKTRRDKTANEAKVMPVNTERRAANFRAVESKAIVMASDPTEMLKKELISENERLRREFDMAEIKLAAAEKQATELHDELNELRPRIAEFQRIETERIEAENSEKFRLNLNSGINIFSLALMVYSATSILGWFGFLLSVFASFLAFRIIWNMQRASASWGTRFFGLLGYGIIEVFAYFLHVINAQRLISQLKESMPADTELPASVQALATAATIFIILVSLLALINSWNETTDKA